jgi:hypothetical protein
MFIYIETAQTAREDVKRGMTAIISELKTKPKIFLMRIITLSAPQFVAEHGEDNALYFALQIISQKNLKSLLFFYS